MNIQERDLMNILIDEPFINQRILSNLSGYSLGTVNKSIKNLMEEGFIDQNVVLTEKAKMEIKKSKPKNAIILAAGFGMRMVPINLENPKGLIEINGEALIERIIKQLHEVGIYSIYIVVGFMKEKYEYLIDKYNVELIVNSQYALKNNLYSMSLVLDKLSNSYIVPCDIWCDKNPFSKNELYSWYMVSNLVDNDSSVRVNRKKELVLVPNTSGGNSMIGISYILDSEAEVIKKNISKMCKNPYYDKKFWEESLCSGNKFIVSARVVDSSDAIEINTYEQLRELDDHSNNLDSGVINVIKDVFHVKNEEISNITVLKKGMTNRSFLFSCKGKKYIMRVPGEGTDLLINRAEEAEVYNIIKDKNISDNIEYINPKNGYKITEFIEGARVCDSGDNNDVKKCMRYLRKFHEMNLSVKHEFDIFKMIDFYESLWNGNESIYRDYKNIKTKIMSLKPYIDKHVDKKVLTHIDAVPDNFLFSKDIKGNEEIRLIDWEYAGMQDPHVDIAMFCIYSLYDREQIDRTIQAYFTEGCSDDIKIKIYCYIAVCGLLWSNWCEYKRNLGVEFGEYSLRQYRYAKEYYKIVQNELENMKGNVR